MTVTQFVLTTQNIFDGYDFFPCSHWDGYVCTPPQPFLDGLFQGYSLNWGIFDNQNAPKPFVDSPYAGYNTNWGAINEPALTNVFVNSPYTGYNTNWGAIEEPLIISQKPLADVDLDSVVDHPKDQTIYYQLKGWNPITLSFESWVISENITGRPPLDGGLFDPNPGRQPPNVERDVFKTPPSGNSLVNIVIAARWIQ